MLAGPIWLVAVIAVAIAVLLLARLGFKQDRSAREARAKPGATSTLPIVALVFAVLVPPVGIVLGHVALYRIAMGEATGRVFAEWALIVGYALLLLELLLIPVLFPTTQWF